MTLAMHLAGSRNAELYARVAATKNGRRLAALAWQVDSNAYWTLLEDGTLCADLVRSLRAERSRREPSMARAIIADSLTAACGLRLYLTLPGVPRNRRSIVNTEWSYSKAMRRVRLNIELGPVPLP